ncbi:TasA family protein [Pseudonocardia halophobica]|uniref:TasA family protein n=1 Tax=Pseudonocardia halophobica TaxID=29401 RepID=UPI003D8A26F3
MSVLQKNKKAAIGIGVAALAVAGLALGTGTYAAFTDTKAGPGGTLAAGTLALNVSTSPTAAATLFNESNLYPGKPIEEKTVTVQNSGTINGKLTGSLTVDTHDGQLQDQMTVQVKCGGGSYSSPITVAAATAAAQNFINSGTPIALNAGQSETCSFKFALPHNATNDVQGDSITISSNLTLTQA